MSHRGRLNVIINIVSRPAAEIFAGFEDVDPRSVLGGGDVKYHIGATGMFTGAKWQAGAHPPGVEPQPPGGGRSRSAGSRAGQADANRARRQTQGAAGSDARRLRLCGAGNHGRDAEPCQPARLHRRRNGAHHRQQPHRLHHESDRCLFRPLLVRSRQAPADSHLSRQRRRCRCGGACRPHGARVSLRVRYRRGGRSHRLPAAWSLRSGRSDHHPADPVSQDQRPSHAVPDLRQERGSRCAAVRGEISGRARRRREGRQEHGQEAADAPVAQLLGAVSWRSLQSGG